MIVPDVNLLLCAHAETAPTHSAAQRWWEALVNDTDFSRFPGLRWRNPL